MSIDDHAHESFGKPVKEWLPGMPIDDPTGKAYRIAIEYDEAEKGVTWEARFSQFLSLPASSSVTSIVVGMWGPPDPLDDSSSIVKLLSQAGSKLRALRALFLGDIIREEYEISWIEQTDMAPIFVAYPQLEHFRVRGGGGLR